MQQSPYHLAILKNFSAIKGSIPAFLRLRILESSLFIPVIKMELDLILLPLAVEMNLSIYPQACTLTVLALIFKHWILLPALTSRFERHSFHCHGDGADAGFHNSGRFFTEG